MIIENFADGVENMKVQVYGTFGPACKSRKILENMIQNGMTGMRLNLSHATLEKSKEYIENYRLAAASCGVSPQILIDMQGPELRIGDMEEITLSEGKRVFLEENKTAVCSEDTDADKDKKQASQKQTSQIEDSISIPVPAAVMSAIKCGMEVLLDDGKIRIRVETVKEQGAEARVLVGGKLKPHKSIKIVDVNVPMPVLTEHDLHNIRLAKEYGVTALMQPFVFSGKDLKEVRQILKSENAKQLQIFAKIENRMGVENLDNILPEADLIVIARGDLGNDMPLWELPVVQKKIENRCKQYGKPYMVVTQMLSSMEQNPIPTRAEVSDIFHAVYYGAEAVMVTGETAVGRYPSEVIKYMANTAQEAVLYRSSEEMK